MSDSVTKLTKGTEAEMERLQVQYLIPLQREGFLCSARCCESSKDLQTIQACTEKCQARIHAGHQIMYGSLQEFQERFQRCGYRCQDIVKESLPAEPSKSDIARAEGMMTECLDRCAKEYLAKLPKMSETITSKLSQL